METKIKKTALVNNIDDEADRLLNTINPGGVDLAELAYKRELNMEKIPNRDDPEIQAKLRVDRISKPTGSGTYQNARNRERNELYQLLQNATIIDSINSRNIDRPAIDANTAESIRYIPNSRLPFYNALIKEGIRNGLSECDAMTVTNVWMPQDSKNELQKLLNKLVDPNKNVLTKPFAIKGVPYDCIKGKLAAKVYNPGNIYVGNSNGQERSGMCACDNSKISNDINQLISKVDAHMCRIVDKYNDDDDFRTLTQLVPDTYANVILYARKLATTGHVDLRKLKEVTAILHDTEKAAKSSYILSLTDPFRYNQQVRIPSLLPVPTATFSVQRNIQLTTNASGNLAFVLAPFYLTTTTETACAINNDVSLTGTASSSFFLGQQLGQVVPASMYTRYRLVSAGVKVLFTSSTLNSTGFCTMAVDFDQSRTAIPGFAISAYAKYGTFNLIENCNYKQTIAVQNGSSMQLNYIPTDTSMQDFWNIGGLPNGFQFVGYITGVQTTAPITVGRLDLILNYEAFVDPNFADYVSTGFPTESNVDLSNMFINNCRSHRAMQPEAMIQHIPSAISHQDLPNRQVPQGEIKVSTPTDSTGIVNTIVDVGKNLITDLVSDKLKGKSITEKLEIADKIKVDTMFDKIATKPSLEGFNPISTFTSAAKTFSPILSSALDLVSNLV